MMKSKKSEYPKSNFSDMTAAIIWVSVYWTERDYYLHFSDYCDLVLLQKFYKLFKIL